MRNSIISSDNPEHCFICNRRNPEHIHHCLHGSYRRLKICSGNKIKAFIEKEFPDDRAPGNIMMQAIQTLQSGIYDKITLKRDRRTYTIDLDKDGFARVKSKYTENTETKF